MCSDHFLEETLLFDSRKRPLKSSHYFRRWQVRLQLSFIICFLHFVSADPEMGRFDDLLFLFHFNVFSDVHCPVKHNGLVISFPRNRFPLFTLSFLLIFSDKEVAS